MDRNNQKKMDETVPTETDAQTKLSHDGTSVKNQCIMSARKRVGLALGHDREKVIEKYYGVLLRKPGSLP